MNYHFTDEVRMALALAREEAVALNHDYVGTEHALLALTREAENRRSVLWKVKVRPESVRKELLLSVRLGRHGSAEDRRGKRPMRMALPYTNRQKKVLELAMSEARHMGHDYVAVEHLLMGLIREEKGIAAQVLWKYGLTVETARALVFAEGDGAEPSDGGRIRIEVDDASTSSIYEQIVAQVREAIATGGLEPGDRLPTVRRLADDLDIAPGTVARAYGELERLGVVVTEGARGTRVADRKRGALASGEREETLTGLLRPVVVAAFHLGASADELRAALEPAMSDIFTAE
jgi:DNA-binding transcriptional regulator YhcF (GntR family)